MCKIYLLWIIGLKNKPSILTMSCHSPILWAPLFRVLLLVATRLSLVDHELIETRNHFIVHEYSFVETSIIEVFLLETEVSRVVRLASDHRSKTGEYATLEGANIELEVCIEFIENLAIDTEAVQYPAIIVLAVRVAYIMISTSI